MNKNRKFTIIDHEADEGHGPTEVTFTLSDLTIKRPEGNKEEYDFVSILRDLIDGSGFNMGLEEVTPQQEPEAFHGLKGTSSGVAAEQDFYQGG